MKLTRHRGTAYLALCSAVALSLSACRSNTTATGSAGTDSPSNTTSMVTSAPSSLTIDSTTYLKADAAYWTKNGSAALAKIASGKYVKLPAGSVAGLDDFKVGPLMDQLFNDGTSSADKMSATVETTDVGGVPAYLMTTRNGDGTKIYVTADGRARLLRAVSPKKHVGALDFGAGTLDFSEWDAVATISAPPVDQILQIPGS